MPDWLNDLIDEYETQHITDNRALRLARAFDNEPDDIMEAAVLSYIRENEYFPKTADLNPHVITAQENARGDKPYYQIDQQDRRSYTDNEMLRWEQHRGTMPEDDCMGYLWEPDNPHLMVVYMLLNWRRALRQMVGIQNGRPALRDIER